jgi:two-component system, chemotaxis family, protein-glutamate methylesterase/glutaminase
VPAHDIVVIGASAGGVEALQAFVRTLPPNFPATLFVVVHVAPRSRSLLPQILSAAGPLPAEHAEDGAAAHPGRIYVAPPDRHLVIEPGHMHLGFGPREQHQRPCINVSFRSAALAYGERVVGVVLTGQLDDGAAGLWEIKRRGGIAVVQHPEEAAFPSMPLSALREIEVDHTVRLEELAPLLVRLAAGSGAAARTGSEGGRREDMQPTLTDLTCPECRGTIWESRRGKTLDYRCRVGHTYSPRTMLAEHFAAQERVIWSAIVAMEEGAALASRLQGELEPDTRERLRAEARQRQDQAAALRQLLQDRQVFAVD